MKFVDYFSQWMELNKEPQVTKITMVKYRNSLKHLQKIAGDVMLSEINRVKLQQIFTEYGKTHHRTTVSDFIAIVYSCVMDAYDEGFIERLPIKKFINNGHTKKRPKSKYLSQNELSALLGVLQLEGQINYDYFILLLAKTGLRYGEALGLTKKDLNMEARTLTVNKTLDYKGLETGQHNIFKKTKNRSSNRIIPLDWHFIVTFQDVIKHLNDDDLIFAPLIGKNGKIYNSQANICLERACEAAEIPIISIHSLRHTHASILIAEGVSMLSVSKRLGHASTAVTQKVYVHLTEELEARDTQAVIKALSGIF